MFDGLPDNQGYLLPWGSSESELNARLHISRSLDIFSSIRPGYRVVSAIVIDGPICCQADFRFRNDSLVSCDLTFASCDFMLMAQCLTERFGLATIEERDRLFWWGGKTVILLHRLTALPDLASAVLIKAGEQDALLDYRSRVESQSNG